MPVKTIILLRHGHRLGWILDHRTGTYTPSSHVLFPTGIPNDPPLASHGVKQAQETAAHLIPLLTPVAKQGRLRIYSSLYYRCLETLKPTVEGLLEAGWQGKVRGERGVGEWFGEAWFSHPAPKSASVLKHNLFPWLDDEHQSHVIPPEKGESVEILHDRIASAYKHVIKDVDEESSKSGEDITLLVCGHAAPIICAGRALTGNKPDDWSEEDFKCFTCGLSRFIRRHPEATDLQECTAERTGQSLWWSPEGVVGGWDCQENSNCSHLSSGEERGWHFNGDESFEIHVGLPGPSDDDGRVAESESISKPGKL